MASSGTNGTLGLALVCSVLVSACGAEFQAGTSSNGGAAGTRTDDGGVSSSGGTGQGGRSGSGSGGHLTKGGATGSGGVIGRGGTPAAGGFQGNGGNGLPGAGGNVVGAGGFPGSGGDGNPSTGGTVGAGGNVSSTGGVPQGSGGNVVGTGGGITSSGGVQGSGGLLGAGGVSVLCVPGQLQCDASRRCNNLGIWTNYTCGPMRVADLLDITTASLPGFDAAGSRCKSLSVCAVSQNCIYFSETLGWTQSTEDAYTDGTAFADPQAIKISIATGSASQCGDPSITIAAGESIALKVTTGVPPIYFPQFSGQSLLLYVREDGATFYDAALTQEAHAGG